MSLALHGYMSERWQNSAARRRCHARYRAALVRILGWEPETTAPGDRYAATTGELRRWAHEERERRSWSASDPRHWSYRTEVST